jgi:hypothetical protein
MLLAAVFKHPDRQVTWLALVAAVRNQHENAQMAFNDAKIESARQKSIKEWISKLEPEQTHIETLQNTKVDSSYAGCGQWLLIKDEFTQWFNSQPGKDILWLRGTSKLS